MAANSDIRIINRFEPSLFHLAVVKISVPLFNDFDIETLDRVFTDIQHGNLAMFSKGYQNNRKANSAKEKLMLIPAHLRHSVLNAVTGLHRAVYSWHSDHSAILRMKVECIFYWRPDGTIDRNKTAEQLVLNENIDVGDRFAIACMYCLEKNVQNLWREMESSGITENLGADYNYMERFWVRWIREGCRVSWVQAVHEYFVLHPILLSNVLTIKMSPFFTLLQQKDRKNILPSLKWCRSDDFRLCLHAVETKEEEEEILKIAPSSLLCLYLDWPLRSSFFEVAEKMWHFLHEFDFCAVLSCIRIYYEEITHDFDYCELYVDFWKSSPNNLRERVKEYPVLINEVNSFFDVITKDRKELSSDTNQKKWIRKNGRLESTP